MLIDQYYDLNVFSLVSLFCNRVLLLLIIPEHLRFITLNILSTLFLLEHISFLNVLMLNLLCHPCLKLDLSGIWSDVFISSFMHVLIGFESYQKNKNNSSTSKTKLKLNNSTPNIKLRDEMKNK